MKHSILFSMVLVVTFGIKGWLHEQPFSQSFSLERTDAAIIVAVDTLKKVTGDDISIMHRKNQVLVDVKGLDHTLKLTLQASKNSFAVSLCSEKIASSGNEKNIKEGDENVREYASFHGASCMQQMISAEVDLENITAEYEGTKLMLSIPVVEPVKSKKIPVTIKEEIKKDTGKKNKKTSVEGHDK